MPLVTTTEMFKKAYEGGYAIGAFNVNNMEIIQGITEAAIENRVHFFGTSEELINKGYKPCGQCHPEREVIIAPGE